MRINNNQLIHRPIFITLIVLFASVFFAGQAAAQDPPGTFIPSSCMFEGIDLGLTQLTGESLGFECGYVVVPERHANPDGSTIRIPVAFRRATGVNAQPDPLFLAQGGPGGDAFEIFTLLVPNTGIAAERDIVIFNQRGTFYAEPALSCPETRAILAETLKADSEEAERLFSDALMACYDRITAEGVDLSAYNSLENAADIPLIAQALGYDEYNFYGVSYGTLLALHLMRNHPEGLRSVILDSVVPTDINFIAETPASEDRVLSEIFAACEADPDCRQQYPDLEERFYALVRKFDAEPVLTTLVDPETGERYETYLDGIGLRDVLFQLLYVPRMPAVLPKVIHDLEQGDLRYIQAMWPLFAFEETVAEGMYFSVICAEDADIDVSTIPVDSLRPEIGDTAQEELQRLVDLCGRWGVEQLPASVDDPVISDIPTLLLSGRFDPVTPPPFAAKVAESLSNATNLVDPAASHGVAFLNPCVNDIMLAFLNDPTTRPDSTCLAATDLPAVVPPNAITLPIMAGINSLEQGLLIRAGIGAILLFVVLSPFVVWPLVWFGRAIMNNRPPVTPENRRLRNTSRFTLLVFGLFALLFSVGLLSFIFVALADQTYATALALPPSAAPLFWLAILLLPLVVALLAIVFMLWDRRGTGSTAGKIYFTIVVLAAVAFIFLIANQGLLFLPI